VSLDTLNKKPLSLNVNNKTRRVDYDLHGMVGIRLVDATENDISVVNRQLGPIQKVLNREPDITVRFIDEIKTSSKLHYLGVNEVAFSDDAFMILRSKHKTRAKVQIPFERIGRNIELTCERGLLGIPLLIPIINLTALRKGNLPLHASAFIYNSFGVLATGWAKGGKTETLLAFMSNGADYVGDEWIYLDPGGKKMYGIPEPIRVWDWHLQYLPDYWGMVSIRDRARLKSINLLVNPLEWVISNGVASRSPSIRMMSRMIPLLKRQLYVHLAPKKIFGTNNSPLEGPLDKMFFVISYEDADIQVKPIDSQRVASQMVYSLQEERQDLISAYLKFRFAFPEVRNELIENLEELQKTALERILRDKEAYVVYHPYPVSIPALFQTLRTYLN
jgi:hypothetical protein